MDFYHDGRAKRREELETRAKFLDGHGPTTDQEAEAWKKERRALAILLGSGSTDLHKKEANAILNELEVERLKAEKEVSEAKIVDKVVEKLKDEDDLNIPTF